MSGYKFEEKLDEIRNLIARLSLNELSKQWVQNVIDADFTDVANFPTDFIDLHDSTNFVGLFQAIISALRNVIDSITPDTTIHEASRRVSMSFLSTTSILDSENEMRDNFTKFWIKSSECFDIKSLLALLFYYIQRGQRYDAIENTRELGIHSASLYFLLLALPGSNAFRVFHPILYLKALDILRLTTKLNIGAMNPKKNVSRSSKMSHRQSSEDENMDDEEAELSFLNPTEASKLTRSLNILLNDFLRLLKKFSLKHSVESLDETIAILVDITRAEIHNAQGVFLNRHAANTVSALAYNSYVAIQSICEPLHGNVQKNLSIVMKYMLNNILMICRGASDLSLRALGVIRDHSITFVKYLAKHMKEQTYEAIYILVQHLCYKVPDKADYREKAAKSVVEILNILPIKIYAKLLRWLYKFSHNDKAGHRLFTLEVISKLLTEDEKKPCNNSTIVETPGDLNFETEKNGLESAENGNSFQNLSIDNSVTAPQNLHVLSHKFLLSIILSRCRDSATTVRSKALHLLAECTISTNPTIIDSMQVIFFNKEALVCVTPHIPNNEINCESPQEELFDDMELPNAEMIMSLLRRRALDDKVTVRKSALQVVENLMKMNEQLVSSNNLKILIDHCRDSALLIRKQVVTSITSIAIMYPDNNEVIKSWVKGILPLILDPEIKVQEKVVENVDQVIFKQIKTYGDPSSSLPWKILKVITQCSFHKFLNKILMMWSQSEFKCPALVTACKSHVGHENNEQSWTLLALLSQYIGIKKPAFVVDYFEENCNFESQVATYTLQQVLKVLRHSISFIPKERSLLLHKALLVPIVNLSVNVEIISAIIDTITIISYALEGEGEKGQKAIEVWAGPILKSCDDFLKKMLFPKEPAPLSKEEEEIFFRYLYTLGDVAQLLPSKVNKRMFLMMQSIIFHQSHSNDSEQQPEMPSTQTQATQAPSITFTPTRRLKALAVVTLGKMCLQHEDQAKRIIPALGKLLDTTSLSSLKINVIFLLSDMCVRYATLVDPLMPQVTACLRDDNVQVRRTTLTLLITLLQEDYLKLKGSFFYRILQCLSDEEEDIRSTVVFYMTERLLKRFPKIFLQHFIECIFHYNCYEEHESYNRFIQSSQEKKIFSLAGAHYRKDRMELYRFMLDHMPDDQRFATTQRLCEDVLGGVVDGRIKLTPSSLPMLEDTLLVLSSEEIKLAWLKSRPEDIDQPTDHLEQAKMADQVIKKTFISTVVKKNVIENIVPILIALKHKLAEHKSPLMKQLLLYFKELMKDYKNEVKEILAGDKQLVKEIEFDLRKIEEEKQREIEEEAASAAASNPARVSSKESEKPLVPCEKITKLQSNAAQLNSVPEGKLSNKTSLVKQAILNSARSIDRRNSFAALNCSSADEGIPMIKSPTKAVLKSPKHPTNNCMVLMQKVEFRKSLDGGLSSVAPNAVSNEFTEIQDKNLENSTVTDDSVENVNADVQNKNLESLMETEESGVKTKKPEMETKEPEMETEEPEMETKEPEMGTKEPEMGTKEPEMGTKEPEMGTKEPEMGTKEPEMGTKEPEMGTKEPEMGTKEPEMGTKEPEMETENIPINEQMSTNQKLAKKRNSVIFSKQQKTRCENLQNANKILTPKSDSKKENLPSGAHYRPTTPKAKREELLRAISTPHQNKNIINDITFINQSQELSAIGVNDSQVSENLDSSNGQQTLLIHFRSPKDDQFSRLCKSSKVKRKLSCVRQLETKKNGRIPLKETIGPSSSEVIRRSGRKRSSGGGFMESFTSSGTDNSNTGTSYNANDDSSCDFVSTNSSPIKKQKKLKTDSTPRLSSTNNRNKNIASLKKSSTKKSRR